MCERKGSPKPWSKAPVAPPSAIPLGVVSALVEQFHVPETEVRTMTKEDAIRRLSMFYSQQ